MQVRTWHLGLGSCAYLEVLTCLWSLGMLALKTETTGTRAVRRASFKSTDATAQIWHVQKAVPPTWRHQSWRGALSLSIQQRSPLAWGCTRFVVSTAFSSSQLLVAAVRSAQDTCRYLDTADIKEFNIYHVHFQQKSWHAAYDIWSPFTRELR